MGAFWSFGSREVRTPENISSIGGVVLYVVRNKMTQIRVSFSQRSLVAHLNFSVGLLRFHLGIFRAIISAIEGRQARNIYSI